MRSSPRKYNRPAVSLAGSVSRVWQDDVPVMALNPGDLVADKGLIVGTLYFRGHYELTFQSGEKVDYGGQASVRAAVPRTP